MVLLTVHVALVANDLWLMLSVMTGGQSIFDFAYFTNGHADSHKSKPQRGGSITAQGETLGYEVKRK
jgi:hypothetical protein